VVPSTLAGVLLFVALLAPGFVYLERRESRHAGIRYTALRETSLVVVTSLATLAVSLSLFGLLRLVFPDRTPDIGKYVRDGSAYAQDHYLEALLWAAGILGFACLLAWLYAVPPERLAKVLGKPKAGGGLSAWVNRQRGSGPIAQISGWTMALDKLPDTQQWLDVVLIDGTSMHGMRGSHSTQIEETIDRDLLLAAPITVRPPGGDWEPLSKAGVVVVSAA
jgi:Family of unknown function (DUF6338)